MNIMSNETEILELRKQGKTYKEITLAVGCSKSLVSYYCGKNQKQKNLQRQNVRKRKIKLAIDKTKSDNGCCECGISDSDLLVFGSSKLPYSTNKLNISTLLQNRLPANVILDETNNRDTFCFNCWRKKSLKRKKVYHRPHVTRSANYIFNLKRESGCKNCDEYNPVALDFHHRNANTKVMEISRAISKGWSITRLMEEIEKCDLLCANCHMKEHRNAAMM